MYNSMTNLINSIVAFKDGSEIPSEHAKLLVQTYRDEEGHGNNKTRAVWFSVPDLAKIIALATGTVDGKTCNGIRIYFAKYPKNDIVIKPPYPEYFSRETLVFVPTYDETVGGSPKHRDLFNVLSPIAYPFDGNQGFNHGELCPPETGCP
jgi:hypothetical protein